MSSNHAPVEVVSACVAFSSEQLSTCSSSAPTSTVSSSSSSPVKTTYCSPTAVNPVKPGPLPPNLDDLKVWATTQLKFDFIDTKLKH